MQPTELHVSDATAVQPVAQRTAPQLLDLRLLKLVGGGTGDPPPAPKEESPKGGW